MTIIEKQGDLLTSECRVLAHCCNCFNTMGGGIAASIRKVFPEAYEVDQLTIRGDSSKLGSFSLAIAKRSTPIPSSYWIYNLYGQYRYGTEKQHLQYDSLRSSLIKMREHLVKHISPAKRELIKIGFPGYMGCRLAGGDWNIVKSDINEIFKDHTVYIYYL
jgi:O-acetyl-ADP-ribose deacetylase (regulator of RNase III)